MIKKKLSKGDILLKLRNKLKVFTIPELICFDISSWDKFSSNILKKISKINSHLLVIRSSATDEDSDNNSTAGLYESYLDVKNNHNDVKDKINKVINSYNLKDNNSLDNQIIAQAQIKSVSMSGVIFTCEMNTGAPYYVINYDDKSGKTDSVTSGTGEYSNRTLYIHRDYKRSELKSPRFTALLNAVKELEENLDSNYLDIEFALDKKFNPYLFQVRKITTSSKWNNKIILEINNQVSVIKKDCKKYFLPDNKIFGEYSVLTQMSDWNPVEMIGRSPKKLDYSLYKMLITDTSWSKARDIMGYFYPKDKHLMILLGGQPYIDTRLSFNSFLPKKLDKKISEKLVNSWLEKLKSNPHLHDKIEFDIAITCYSFDIEEKIKNLKNILVDSYEKKLIIKKYKELTLNLINSKNKASISNCFKQIEYLNSLFSKKYSKLEKLNQSDLNELIDFTINYGIIPFAILARHAFISKTLFESLSIYDDFNKSFFDSFYKSISTIATDFHNDSLKFSRNEISYNDFIKKYGHLRPGSYDITSMRYDMMSTNVFKSNSSEKNSPPREKIISIKKMKKIDDILKEHNFHNINAQIFLNYIKKSIQGREYAKFVFTKNLSLILEIIAKFASKNKLSRESISNLDINEITAFNYKKNKIELKKKINKIIKQRKKNIELANAIKLPQILSDISGTHVIPFQVSQPNYITNKIVECEVFILDNVLDVSFTKNKIVVIENADPGYDFIFNYPIKGLITKFGGINSHMAIRCAEFDIPAAIGCGEQIFESIINQGAIIKLNCLTKKITKVI